MTEQNEPKDVLDVHSGEEEDCHICNPKPSLDEVILTRERRNAINNEIWDKEFHPFDFEKDTISLRCCEAQHTIDEDVFIAWLKSDKVTTAIIKACMKLGWMLDTEKAKSIGQAVISEMKE